MHDLAKTVVSQYLSVQLYAVIVYRQKIFGGQKHGLRASIRESEERVDFSHCGVRE